MSKKKKSIECPCGSGLAFRDCCEPYLTGSRQAPTAEALMRSRYCAYTLGNQEYILQTWHPSTRPDALDSVTSAAIKWTGLQVIAVEGGRDTDRHGTVEFIARYKQQGRAQRLQERSRFVREDGTWFYVDAMEPRTDT